MLFDHLVILFAIAAVTVVALLMLKKRPQDRSTVLRTLSIGGLGFVVFALGLALFGVAPGLSGTLQETGIVALGIALIRLCGLTTFRLVLPSLNVNAPRITEDLLVVAAYIAWAFIRLRYAGVNFTGLVTASAVMTGIIAISMQSTLGSILGGIALQLDDSLQIGDWIKVEGRGFQIDDLVGEVIQVRWRSTTLRMRSGEIVVIPNNTLMTASFIVLGRQNEAQPRWRRLVRFDVPDNVPPVRVIDVVESVLHESNIDHVATDPKPDCLLVGFDRSSCQFAIRYWLTDVLLDQQTDSAVRAHLYSALRIITQNAEFEAMRDKRELDRRVAVLQQLELFSNLTPEECSTLASRLISAKYHAGEVITKQGSIAHWLYMITSGTAGILLEQANGARIEVNQLQPGGFFGEMALLTGEARRATVIAKTDVEVYRLDKQSFADIIEARPSIAEDMSHILIKRQAAIDAAKRDNPERQESDRHELLGKIRHFFGIKHH